MAYPSLTSAPTTASRTSAGTSLDITLPTTINAGDTIFVFIRVAVAGAIGWPDANWTELFDASPDGADDQIAAAWKKAVGTEGGTTITITTGDGKSAAFAYAVGTAADPAVRPPELSTVATGTSPNQPDATTCTPTGGAKEYLWITFFGIEGEQTGITSYPTNYTLGQTGLVSTGGGGATSTNVRVAAAAREATAASEDAGAWSIAGTLINWSAYTIAFHPETNLSRTVPAEGPKPSDQVTVALSPLEPPLLQDGLRVTDTVTALLPELVVSLQDGVVVAAAHTDNAAEFLDLEAVRPVDATPLAERVDIEVGPSVDVSPPDGVRLTEALTVVLSPLVAALQQDGAKVTEAPTPALTPLVPPLQQESLRVSETLTRVLSPLVAAPQEGLRPADAPVVVLSPLVAAVGPEHATPVDQRTVVLSPLVASATEGLRPSETPVVVLSPLAAAVQEGVRPSDAAEGSIGLEATPLDALRVVDLVSPVLSPLQASAQEDARVSETATPALTPLVVTVAEGLRPADPLTVVLSPLVVDRGEAVRVADLATPVLSPLVVGAQEGLTPADLLTVVLSPLVASAQEGVTTADALTPPELIEQLGQLTAEATEGLTPADTVTAALQLAVALSPEGVRPSDAPTAVLTPLAAVLQDGLQPSESVSRVMQLGVVVAAEGIRPSEGPASPTLSPLATALAEAVTPVDVALADLSNNLFVEVAEGLRIVEALTPAVTPLRGAVASEGLTPSDTVVAVLSPLAASASDALRLADQRTVAMHLAAAPTDGLRVGEGLTVVLSPLAAAVQDGLTAADTTPVTGANLVGQAQEALHVTEAVVATITPIGASATERLTPADVPAAALTPLVVTLTDGVRLADPVAALLPVLTAARQEGLVVTDTAAPSMALIASASDGIVVADQVGATLATLAVAITEGLAVSDAPAARLALLQVAVQEGVGLADVLSTATGLATSLTDALAVGDPAPVRTLTPLQAGARYTVTSLSVAVGSIVSGALIDTQATGGGALVLGETIGTPAFDYRFTFVGPITPRLQAVFTAYYDGNAGHVVRLQQWNYTTVGWDDVTANATDLPDAVAFATYRFPLLTAADYLQNNTVQLRLVHTSPGNPMHALHLDAIALEDPPDGARIGDALAVALDRAVQVQPESLAVGDASDQSLAVLQTAVTEGMILGEAVASGIDLLSVAVEEALAVADAPASLAQGNGVSYLAVASESLQFARASEEVLRAATVAVESLAPWKG